MNNTASKFEGTAPKLARNNSYSFILNSQWTTNTTVATNVASSSSQLVKVEISPQTYTGYKEVVLEAATVSSQVLVGVSATTTIGISAVRGTSFAGFYLILHQLQMIILFLLIDPFIPESVMNYLEGQSFALVTFNFISSEDIPILKLFVKWIGTVQENETFNRLNFESESTLANHTTFFLILLTIIGIHLSLKYLLKCKN